MPTIVTSSIGTNSRDYSTIQAWEDACPSNLVSEDKVWKGECYNDSEFTGGVQIGGQTTDATRYVWLTAADGESFIDHADAAPNPLTYDQSKGVGISANPTEVPLIDVYTSNTRIDRLQIKRSGWQFGHPPVRLRTGSFIKQCLIENSASAPSGGYTLYLDEGSKAENCCAIARTSNQHGIGLFFSSIADSCTVVCDSAAGESGGTGINDVHGNATAKNCAVFGFATPSAGSFNASSGYNATDKASGLPGSNNLYNLTASNQFVNTSNDFRVKAGADLIDAGGTSLTTDIIGQTRSAPDIGAWEYVASGGGTPLTVSDPTGEAAVDTGAVTQTHALAASDAAATGSIDTPVITQTHTLAATDADATGAVETPALTQIQALAALDAESAGTVDTSVVTQTHALTAADPAAEGVIDTGAVQQTHHLAASDPSATGEVDTVTLPTGLLLTADDPASTGTVDTAAIVQTHALAAQDAAATPAIDAPALTQTHTLSAADPAATGEVDTVSLAAGIVLTASDLEASGAIDSGALVQVHLLTALSPYVEPEVDVGMLIQHHLLSAADVEAAGSIDTINLAGTGLGDILNPSLYRATPRRTLRRL